MCGNYAPPTVLPSGPSTAGGYRLISASKAFAALQPNQHTGGCAEPHTPVTLIEARLGQATYDTDRGAMSFPAWVFSFAGVEGPVSVLAIATEAEWSPTGHPSATSYNIWASVGADHRTLTVSFIGAQSEDGPCGVKYAVKLTETPTVVMVTVIRSPNESTAICDLVGYVRHASGVLEAQMGARVLIDDAGSPIGATGSP
jgi:hypothetical protein